ncbi:MAG: NAD(P)-dependent oxidoreductase [Rhizobiales bacterium]|nr:NAD(P)-dependent oxidoreductase [Hyphomicrobiales bacterium]
MELGFIGLGRMGQPMARRLIEAGHRLVVFDTQTRAVETAVRHGAQAAKSSADVADRVETVFASLPTPDVVLSVATGKDGVSEGKRVRTFIDLSTTGARMAMRVAAALKQKNIVQLDAPVSGGTPGAEKGTLAVMVSGPRAEFDRLEAVFKVFGRPFHIGEAAGLGQTMKLLNNLLSATTLAATCEAIAIGVKAGLDPALMIDVLNVGTGRSSASLDKFPRAILPGTYNGGFAMGLMVKDVRLCLEETRALGLTMQIAECVEQLWEATERETGADADSTLIMKSIERRAGVKIDAREKG